MNIIVTGGLGYIGSHVCVELIEHNYNVIIVDNLCNSSKRSLERIKQITNVLPKFYEVDICNKEALETVFFENDVQVVIHCAGKKDIGIAKHKPIDFYDNNICGIINLIKCMTVHKCFNLIYSSSATIYETSLNTHFKEDDFIGYNDNPYSTSKLLTERLLKDLCESDKRWNIISLRYFKTIGAHKSGLIGENPNSVPNTIIPYITEVQFGHMPFIKIDRNNYPTKDGTLVRDYIHVCDLSKAYLLSIKKLIEHPGYLVLNIGSGIETSILDLIKAFEEAFGKNIPYVVDEKDNNIIGSLTLDVSKAKKEIGFKAKLSLNDMAKDTWKWIKNNPEGIL